MLGVPDDEAELVGLLDWDGVFDGVDDEDGVLVGVLDEDGVVVKLGDGAWRVRETVCTAHWVRPALAIAQPSILRSFAVAPFMKFEKVRFVA